MRTFLPAVLAVFVSGTAFAQGLAVLPVPQVALDPSAPHFASNGHATTFKAIARGGNGTYFVEWDFDGDGTFDFSAVRTNRYDLSTRFTYPNQAADKTFTAVVRVTSNGQTVLGTYPVRVFADVPVDPAVANERQLQVKRNTAIDDGLWYLHTQLQRTGNEADLLSGAQVSATFSDPNLRVLQDGSFLEALGRNGHTPAFPSASYLGTMPNPVVNDARWATDPYAEDAMRLVNFLLLQATVVAVATADEVN